MNRRFDYGKFLRETNSLSEPVATLSDGNNNNSHESSTSSSSKASSVQKATSPRESFTSGKKAPPIVNREAGREMKRLVGTVKPGSRVGRILEMLEKNNWEVENNKQQQQKQQSNGSSRSQSAAQPSTVSPREAVPSKPAPVCASVVAVSQLAQSDAPKEAQATAAAPAKPRELSPERRVFAYGLGSVQGKRPTMEDAHAAFLSLPKNPDAAFFGVFDGHAGDESSNYVAESLHDEVDRALAKETSSAGWKKAITSAFSTVDENLMDESESMMWTSGTTVVCAVYHKKERQLWVANLGDSRCVLARQEHGGRVKGEALSLDHKPWDEEERKRIELAGCRVTQGRINGTHAMSRALGDFELKNNINLDLRDQAISNVPDIRQVTIAGNELFCVLACDGLYDVMDDQQVAEWVHERLVSTNDDLNTIADRLANHAVEIGSTDNVSVLVVTFPHP
jgi:protein phosphatase 2C family protein 2/3